MDPSQERAEQVLAKVPEWLWDGVTLPVPVEGIADDVYGLLVREMDDLSTAPGAPVLPDGHALSGLLLASRGEIWVSAYDAQRWPGRRRFTIGHELGHWELHRTGQQSLFCRAAAVNDELPFERPPLPPPEEEANAFAAALLMPSFLFIDQHAACGGDVEQLCARFGASKKAVDRRIADLFASTPEG